jgi:ATP-dependent helicase HepA
MLGSLVRHEEYGEGRIKNTIAGKLAVHFFENAQEFRFAQDALNQGFLRRLILELGRPCTGPSGSCRVKNLVHNQNGQLRVYRVEYDNGNEEIVTEAELQPSHTKDPPSAIARLANRDLDHLTSFLSRENLQIASFLSLKNSGNLAALQSARIDLHPHQAFVAGVILDDFHKRYILADEVGLGKTVEAGVVIQDLLWGRQSARVLIICPGTLTQQWFCEMYSKFGGRVFTLLDLHVGRAINWSSLSQVIVSMSQILTEAGEELLKNNWDLVVVDECHHLLRLPKLFDFVRTLSRSVKGLLMLSAIPAERRRDELFHLLSLLEPNRFDTNDPASVQAFEHLYEAQPQIGRRLQPLIIRLRGLSAGEYTLEDVQRQADRLIEVPIIQNDQHATQLARSIQGNPDEIIKSTERLIDYVADRYRIHRRILRNRRQHLIRDGKLIPVRRICEMRPFDAGPLEQVAQQTVADLLTQAQSKCPDPAVLRILTKLVWQSLASSAYALQLLEPVLTAQRSMLNQSGRDFLALGQLAGYDDWALYLELLQVAAAAVLPKALLKETVNALKQWHRSSERHERFQHLVQRLREEWRVDPNLKLLIFAGYPGLASDLADQLSTEFGDETVAQFLSEMPRSEKEEAVQNFRKDIQKRLLVSDESGGEGRNFEFAGALVHYDHPWHVGRIEQRIGRLDRIGRTVHSADVRSILIFSRSSVEEAIVNCYDRGFGVYTESISGLEFSLRDQEERVCEAVLVDGIDGLARLVPEIRQAADDERARDEHQALLDWASFQEDRVRRYLSVHNKPEIERQLESAFVGYFRHLADQGAAKPYGDHRSAEGLWRFKADSVRFGKVLPQNLAGQITGTFRRSVSQQRLDLEFFQVGNLFFDAIVAAALTHPFGRTYAVQCKAVNRVPWAGFEFIFSAQPRRDKISDRNDLMHLIDSYFSFQPTCVFVDVDGRLEPDATALRTVRRSLTKENKNTIWTHLWNEREALLGAFIKPDKWAQVVYEYSELAKERAIEIFRERLEASLFEQCRHWENLVRQAGERQIELLPAEFESLQLLLGSARGWTAQVEGAGFLAINQPI